MNLDFYEKGVHQKHHLESKGVHGQSKGGAPGAGKEEPVATEEEITSEEKMQIQRTKEEIRKQMNIRK